MLSSLNDECKSDNYIEPHYKEWYRVAVDTLIEHGLDAYEEFLAKERVSDFLAEEEINYILNNVLSFAICFHIFYSSKTQRLPAGTSRGRHSVDVTPAPNKSSIVFWSAKPYYLV